MFQRISHTGKGVTYAEQIYYSGYVLQTQKINCTMYIVDADTDFELGQVKRFQLNCDADGSACQVNDHYCCSNDCVDGRCATVEIKDWFEK